MDTKAITERLQGFLDELIRAEPVRDAEAIVAAKAAATERLAALLNDMPKPEKAKLEMPKAKEPVKADEPKAKEPAFETSKHPRTTKF